MAPKPSKPAPKRAHQEESRKHTPNNTKKPREYEEEKPISTPVITRVWSDQDEVSLLNGMIRYKAEKGLEPHCDLTAFHGFMKGKMGSFSKEQMRSKMKRLRKRFLNALKNGEDPVFSNRHEDVLFEISKKVWGGVGENVAEEDVVEVGGEDEGVGEGFWSRYPYLSASFDRLLEGFGILGAAMSFVKGKLSATGDAKAEELERKLKEIIVEETELNCKMLALITEEAKKTLNQ